jgi:hypothetical protein
MLARWSGASPPSKPPPTRGQRPLDPAFVYREWERGVVGATLIMVGRCPSPIPDQTNGFQRPLGLWWVGVWGRAKPSPSVTSAQFSQQPPALPRLSALLMSGRLFAESQ